MGEQWMVQTGGQEHGPYDEATVIEAIASGLRLDAMVRLTSEAGWRKLDAHGPFARAIPGTSKAAPAAATTAPAMTTTAPRPVRSPWLVVSAIASVVSLLVTAAVLAAGFVAFDRMQQWHVEALAEAQNGTRAIRDTESSTLVDLSAVPHNCLASNTGIDCTFTNTGKAAVRTCLQGQLTLVEGGAAPMLSMPLCSGRLLPQETKAVSATWAGGFARELCSSKNRWGDTRLNWDKCKFETVAFQIGESR